MNQVEIVKRYCSFVESDLRNKDYSELDGFLEDYDDEDEVFDLITSVEYAVITKEEYNDLLECKAVHEGLSR